MEKATRKSEPPVEERFGPWMQVVSRKRRPGALRRGSLPDNSGIELGGSKTETRVKMATAVSRGKRPVVVKSVERSGSVGLAKDRNVQPGLHGVGNGWNSISMVHQESVSLLPSSPQLRPRGRLYKSPMFFNRRNTLRFRLSMMVLPVH
ncbi:hypothetical protein V6N11_067085 [Hibiscus sabdariffa]|uniref:Uncharacterized protein n=1 Tax=Hibiscus sabdariffa TaxID=183260 RepID=A0ABR2SQN5_9ROSI